MVPRGCPQQKKNSGVLQDSAAVQRRQSVAVDGWCPLTAACRPPPSNRPSMGRAVGPQKTPFSCRDPPHCNGPPHALPHGVHVTGPRNGPVTVPGEREIKNVRHLVRRKFGTDSEMHTHKLPGLWHKQQQRPCMVVVMSCGCLVGCGCCLEASGGSLGGFAVLSWRHPKACCWAQRKCACQERCRRYPPKNWLRTLKYRGTIWRTFVVPNFAIPNSASSYFPPPPALGARQPRDMGRDGTL